MFSFSIPKSSFAAAGMAAAVGFIGFVEVSPVEAATVIKNGDFSNGLTGWSTIGNVVNSGGAADLNAGGGSNTPSVETFLGLAGGTLAGIGDNPTVGSAIKQSFKANAGTAVNFDWQFATDDYLPFNDFAFYSLVSSVGDAILLSNVKRVGNGGNSGLVNLSFVIPDTDTYTLGFGIMNSRDNDYLSTLLVDNVRVYTTDIPTPALLPGLIGMGVAAIRKRKQGEVEQEA